MQTRVRLLVFLFAFALAATLRADPASPPPLHLHGLFRDHAVLQRGVPLPVWGTASAGDSITVDFAGQRIATTADADGRWQVTLAPLTASTTPQSLIITGITTVRVDDVLVGDVWLASGQSNMERALGPCRPSQRDITGWRGAAAAANLPLIREFRVPRHYAATPQRDVEGHWSVATPANALAFSAVGFFFARALQPHAGVPIGVLHAAWGGTPAESWTSADALESLPDFRDMITQPPQQRYTDQVDAWMHTHDPGSAPEAPWHAVDLATNDWHRARIPASFETLGHARFNGVLWLRREVDLPEACASLPARLHLGAIDDQDTTWVNGTRVGGEFFWDRPRAYPVPAGTLRAGRNVIAIRIVNTGGPGGFLAEPADMALTFDRNLPSVPLAGAWWSRRGVDISDAGFTQQLEAPERAPAVLFNAMIAPLIPFPIRGVAWYQGESNAGRATQYRTLLPALIADWRTRWNAPTLPFLVVQITPHMHIAPEIREAQLLTVQALTNTALIVTTDVGDVLDIHPPNKRPVGERLALAARALSYGEPVTYSGPQFAGMTVTNGAAWLSFAHVGAGLTTSDGGRLRGFTIAGADGRFMRARAEIHGDRVRVSHRKVPQPVAVRYGWANVPNVNLANREGLPASPFRTDAPAAPY